MNIPFLAILNPLHPWRVRRSAGVLAFLMAGVLVGCGGGGSDPGTLAGVAATGAPVVGGTVDVVCVAGTPAQATTSGTGTWSVSLAGQTLPCKVRVTGGNLTAGTAYHAIGLAPGIVNITPLTELVVAQLAGAAPATWFGQRTAADFQRLTATALASALETVRKALAGEPGLAGLGTFDPLTGPFAATASDPFDKLLDTLKALFPNYAALLNAAQAPSFSAATAQAGKVTSSGGISAPLATAGPYTIAYTGALCPSSICDVGLDVRSGVKGTFGSRGELTAYTYSADEAPSLGTGSVQELGGNADLTWGRWAAGQLAGKFYNLTYQSIPMNEANGFHYVIGQQTPVLPTSGSATYTAVGATALSYTNFGPTNKVGSIDLANCKAAVDFATGKVGFEIRYGLANAAGMTTYGINTPGGTAAVASSTYAFGNSFAPSKVAYAEGQVRLQTTLNGNPFTESFNLNTFAYLVPYGADAAYLALVFRDGGRGAGLVIFKKN